MKNLLFLFLFIGTALSLQAQTTGSFQQQVTFAESDYSATRTLYYFVPTDYDATQSYPLVVGFRGGPHSNAGEFRDQLTFLADSIGAIVLCPENSAHFWNEEGLTKQLFRYSVAHALSEYSIDSDFIYLTGLSYGGRHAVIVAMDTDDGAIPAIRGVIPFAAGSDSQLQPNYENIADFAPACICIGLNDSNNFIGVSNDLHDDIQANGGVSILNEVPGVGHTVAFANYPAEMMECINFIDAQADITQTVDPILSAQLSVYPNPATANIQLQFPTDWKVSTIEILQLSGQVVARPSTNPTSLSIAELPSGTYFLRLITEAGIAVTQVVVQH